MIDTKQQISGSVEFDVFIEGKEVDLVAVNQDLVEWTDWYTWFNDEELMSGMQHHYFPNTKSMQRQFVREEIKGNSTKIQCGVLHKIDRKFIGVVSLDHIDFLNRKCDIACLIGDKKYQKLSYIVEALQLIIAHAFDQLNIHKINGGSITREVSDLFVRTLGFRNEGQKRCEVYKNGQYHDVYLFGLLKDEFKSSETATD